MRVWLVNVGEPLPIDGENVRLHRTGILAEYLLDAGHKVLWWTSTFNHQQKRQRFRSNKEIKINPKYTLRLMKGITYKKNISFKRLIDHWLIGQKFKRAIMRESLPDIVIASMPTIELAHHVSMFGRRKRIPVIVDIRDLWPEIFVKLAPSFAQPIARAIFLPMFLQLSQACKSAFAITGNTDKFVEWGLKYARREQKTYDRSFPFGYSQKKLNKKSVNEAQEYWKKLGLDSNNKFVICLVGNFGQLFKYEFSEAMLAAKSLTKKSKNIVFVFCGQGVCLNEYKEMTSKCERVFFTGWLDKHYIYELLKLASVGLLPYSSDSFDFMMSVPNKVIEYFSEGVPVVSSLSGVTGDLLKKNKCGLAYPSGKRGDLISIIEKLYREKRQLKQMSNNAKKLFKEKYTADKVYGDMVKYLENIVKEYKKKNV